MEGEPGKPNTKTMLTMSKEIIKVRRQKALSTEITVWKSTAAGIRHDLFTNNSFVVNVFTDTIINDYKTVLVKARVL